MSEWRDRAGPWARATLPDGQALDVLVVARRRTSDGVWWYECEAILPVRYVHETGATEQKAEPAPISVHSDRITPIPGERYDSVPTVGAEEGRQWVAVQARGTRGRGPWWALHHRACWATGGGRSRRITTEQARELLAASGWVCDTCRPEVQLGQARSPEPGPHA